MSEAIFLAGRSGTGKSSVGYEMHAQLSAARVRHCLIEGDNLDQAYPPPWEHGLAERNLAAMWANYRALGYRRMIYTAAASRAGDRHRAGLARRAQRPDGPQAGPERARLGAQSGHRRQAGC